MNQGAAIIIGAGPAGLTAAIAQAHNQDHSTLTAMTAMDNIVNGISAKENHWQISAEVDDREEAREVAK
jgi:thioredoxin reductase